MGSGTAVATSSAPHHAPLVHWSQAIAALILVVVAVGLVLAGTRDVALWAALRVFLTRRPMAVLGVAVGAAGVVLGAVALSDIVEPAEAAAGAAWFAALVGAWTLVQARRESRDQSRPMVAAELRPRPWDDHTMSLVVREIPDTTEPTSLAPYVKHRYAQPIPVLIPGVELDNIWIVGEEHHGQYRHIDATPPQVTVTIAYDGPDGRRYTEPFHSTWTSTRGGPTSCRRRTRCSRRRRPWSTSGGSPKRSTRSLERPGAPSTHPTVDGLGEPR
jgi:hypothetical protein